MRYGVLAYALGLRYAAWVHALGSTVRGMARWRMPWEVWVEVCDAGACPGKYGLRCGALVHACCSGKLLEWLIVDGRGPRRRPTSESARGGKTGPPAASDGTDNMCTP